MSVLSVYCPLLPAANRNKPAYEHNGEALLTNKEKLASDVSKPVTEQARDEMQGCHGEDVIVKA